MAVSGGKDSLAVWDILLELGCDHAQGFLLARPMPADELVGQLSRMMQHGIMPEKLARVLSCAGRLRSPVYRAIATARCAVVPKGCASRN